MVVGCFFCQPWLLFYHASRVACYIDCPYTSLGFGCEEGHPSDQLPLDCFIYY
ncbi:hypothetical protein LINPERHAP1_LOCUS37849 [Linum perenne]